MAQEYSEYLAANVLNEQQYVNYRNLSRALKVHSNIAKQMLYDFHLKQNSRKPGSVHATYLITGTKRIAYQANNIHSQDDGEDSIMQSSPPLPGSSIPHSTDDEPIERIAVKTIMLVKEENLDQAREQFESITGMHVYSLQANNPKDMHVLSDCNRRVTIEYASEDPLKDWKQYGTIQNANVKRRTGKRPPPPPAAPVPKLESAQAKAAASAVGKSSTAEVSMKPSAKDAKTEQSNSMTIKPKATKKQEHSIFKSFAKGAPKLDKSKSQQSSASASPMVAPAAVPEDVPMTGFSDDDVDDEAGSGIPDETEDMKMPSGKSRKDRQAELQAMMDQEDEPMKDAGTPPVEDEKHDEGAIDQVESLDKAEPNETVVVENGRRRGRRRVMKKKTVKDEEGYLVTREEPAWESFSEDEPPPKKPKVQAPPVGKKGAKAGQGNIMSFFSKK